MIVFFNDTATTEIYTLSLHDALPICQIAAASQGPNGAAVQTLLAQLAAGQAPNGAGVQTLVSQLATRLNNLGTTVDRKSTRLNSSHANISYAVFCLKKKTNVIPKY